MQRYDYSRIKKIYIHAPPCSGAKNLAAFVCAQEVRNSSFTGTVTKIAKTGHAAARPSFCRIEETMRQIVTTIRTTTIKTTKVASVRFSDCPAQIWS